MWDQVRVKEESEEEWDCKSSKAFFRFCFLTSISFIAADIAFIVVPIFDSSSSFFRNPNFIYCVRLLCIQNPPDPNSSNLMLPIPTPKDVSISLF